MYALTPALLSLGLICSQQAASAYMTPLAAFSCFKTAWFPPHLPQACNT